MSARTILGAAALIVVTALVTTQVVSQDTGKGKKEAGQIPPEIQKMIEAGTPGPNHKLLEKTAGSWTYTMKHRMDATSDFVDCSGTCENKSIFGGRFVQETTKGTNPDGSPFEGIGYAGYDNVSKKFVSAWLCSMGTGIMLSEGTLDSTGKTITYTGECSCPITEGGMAKMKFVHTITDDNRMDFVGFAYDKTGKEYKSMEIKYARAGMKK